MNKRSTGRYYTKGNPFSLHAFKDWAKKADLENNIVLEPFAGQNNIIQLLQNVAYSFDYKSYDINPGSSRVLKRDTLTNFPTKFKTCITNPPWLARNSAVRRGLPFPKMNYNDLYKFALSLCLENCEYVAAIIPESFITSGLFLERTNSIISLANIMFDDTEHPSCLALFEPQTNKTKVKIYKNDLLLGNLNELKNYLPEIKTRKSDIKFNAPDGNVGFIAVDNNFSASIRFCDIEELSDYEVKQSSRSITKIKINHQFNIKDLNKRIDLFRKNTSDVFLTAFKGLRKDGAYRRRMDYKIARGIILESISKQ